jgi:hypothetical protein
MQKLALMMAVMILGMSPAHGCSISADPRSRGGGDQAEMMLLPSTWSGDGGKVLMTEDMISSTTAKGGPPVEPAGGHPIGRILQRIQLGVEGLARVRYEVPSTKQGTAKERPEAREYNPGLGESSRESRPKREAAQKAMDALKKGADATRGRGRRRGRVYQRAGIRN